MNTKSTKKFVLVLDSDKSLIQSFNYRTEFKQRAAAERQARKLMRDVRYDKIVVMDYSEYQMRGYDKLTRVVRNLMNGKEVVESINTPNCCSVASETYWSM